MSTDSTIFLPRAMQEQLWQHLLPRRMEIEEAAFVFAKHEGEDGQNSFRAVEWYPVPPEGFDIQSAYHIELSDETRGWVIKRAHDLGASVVEFHSHTNGGPARFSVSDRTGFDEFVPHVWWRLKGKPYAAVVVARSGFDGFAWLADPRSPERLGSIVADGQAMIPSRRSPLGLDDYYRELRDDTPRGWWRALWRRHD